MQYCHTLILKTEVFNKVCLSNAFQLCCMIFCYSLINCLPRTQVKCHHLFAAQVLLLNNLSKNQNIQVF